LPAEALSTEKGPSNRSVAWMVLGAMAVMAVVGLSFALSTVDFRNRNHQGRPVVQINKQAIDDPRTVAAVAPAELPALGYLPTDSNIVGAVHVAEILHDPVGRKFLESPSPAPIKQALASIEQWTGLKAESLDQVVFGVHVGTAVPRICVIAQTRQPYDRAALTTAKAIHGSKASEFRHRLLYHFALGPIGNGLLWCADDRTLVCLVRLDGTREEDMSVLPETPRHAADGLPAPLLALLQKRLARGTLIWLAGHFEKPEILSPLLAFSQVPPESEQLITSIATFGAGLRFQSGITLMADLHTTDAGAALRLAEYLQRQTAPVGKVASSLAPYAHPQMWAAPVAAGHAPVATWPLTTAASLSAATHIASHAMPVDEVNWVTLQVRADADVIRGMVNDASKFMPRVGHP
jgi:hypothetical protein